jgi:hypothetical protein
MPIKIECSDITIEQIVQLFTFLTSTGIDYTLHIETKDKQHDKQA